MANLFCIPKEWKSFLKKKRWITRYTLGDVHTWRKPKWRGGHNPSPPLSEEEETSCSSPSPCQKKSYFAKQYRVWEHVKEFTWTFIITFKIVSDLLFPNGEVHSVTFPVPCSNCLERRALQRTWPKLDWVCQVCTTMFRGLSHFKNRPYMHKKKSVSFKTFWRLIVSVCKKGQNWPFLA